MVRLKCQGKVIGTSGHVSEDLGHHWQPFPQSFVHKHLHSRMAKIGENCWLLVWFRVAKVCFNLSTLWYTEQIWKHDEHLQLAMFVMFRFAIWSCLCRWQMDLSLKFQHLEDEDSCCCWWGSNPTEKNRATIRQNGINHRTQPANRIETGSTRSGWGQWCMNSLWEISFKFSPRSWTSYEYDSFLRFPVKLDVFKTCSSLAICCQNHVDIGHCLGVAHIGMAESWWSPKLGWLEVSKTTNSLVGYPSFFNHRFFRHNGKTCRKMSQEK